MKIIKRKQIVPFREALKLYLESLDEGKTGDSFHSVMMYCDGSGRISTGGDNIVAQFSDRKELKKIIRKGLK